MVFQIGRVGVVGCLVLLSLALTYRNLLPSHLTEMCTARNPEQFFFSSYFSCLQLILTCAEPHSIQLVALLDEHQSSPGRAEMQHLAALLGLCVGVLNRP